MSLRRAAKIVSTAILVLALLGQAMPRITAVEPTEGRVGDELTALGENLDGAHVAELRLTDGANDFKALITAQTASAIKFKIPEVKPGRYGLVTFSKRIPQSLEIEQPVKVTIKQ